jgi:serpin B
VGETKHQRGKNPMALIRILNLSGKAHPSQSPNMKITATIVTILVFFLIYLHWGNTFLYYPVTGVNLVLVLILVAINSKNRSKTGQTKAVNILTGVLSIFITLNWGLHRWKDYLDVRPDPFVTFVREEERKSELLAAKQIEEGNYFNTEPINETEQEKGEDLSNLYNIAPQQQPEQKKTVSAINRLGLNLLKKQNTGENLLVSPYSIQTVLAMAYAGSAGKTKKEMEETLGFNPEATHIGINGIQKALNISVTKTNKTEPEHEGFGDLGEVTLKMANQLFGQSQFPFKKEFLEILQDHYGSPIQYLDFRNSPEPSRETINRWVKEKTDNRIEDLIPQGVIDSRTRITLANAISFKATWQTAFSEKQTTDSEFHTDKGPVIVPTMKAEEYFGYTKKPGWETITIPYIGDEFQFVIVLPGKNLGLQRLIQELNDEDLAEYATTQGFKVDLQLPKIKLEERITPLKETLESLGMKLAFDPNPGKADFRNMTESQEEPISITDISHKTSLEIDEEGTSAQASSSMYMMAFGVEEVIPVKIDRPFLFMIQHRPSKLCLFIGAISNPKNE